MASRQVALLFGCESTNGSQKYHEQLPARFSKLLSNFNTVVEAYQVLEAFYNYRQQSRDAKREQNDIVPIPDEEKLRVEVSSAEIIQYFAKHEKEAAEGSKTK